jgi:short-subunit dehydrogenase
MMTELTLPFMPRGARIINLDSLSAFQPVPYLNVYAATKAFVLSYSRAMNAELHDRGISVTAVCPGWVKTEFFDRAEKTSTTAVTYFNHVYLPQDVIRTAVRDAYKRKAVSVHGAAIKWQVFLVKLLPHSLVMRIWLHQQKHK